MFQVPVRKYKSQKQETELFYCNRSRVECQSISRGFASETSCDTCSITHLRDSVGVRELSKRLFSPKTVGLTCPYILLLLAFKHFSKSCRFGFKNSQLSFHVELRCVAVTVASPNIAPTLCLHSGALGWNYPRNLTKEANFGTDVSP